jgi:hypothetical protein
MGANGKRLVLMATAAVAGFVGVWLVTSFVFWDLDPGHWDSLARFMAVWIGMVASMCLMAVGWEATEND